MSKEEKFKVGDAVNCYGIETTIVEIDGQDDQFPYLTENNLWVSEEEIIPSKIKPLTPAPVIKINQVTGVRKKKKDMSEFIFNSVKKENGKTLHNIKCVEPYYYEVSMGQKTFEIRKDDREFEYSVGDSLVLYQVKGGILTGEWMVRSVVYVLRHAPDYGLKPGYVIMGIK